MVTLDQVKEFMNIDYIDADAKLSQLLDGEIRRAETITGRNYTNVLLPTYEVMSTNIANAIIRGVESNFVQSNDFGTDGSNNESVNASLYAYRSECTRPMF